MKQEEIAPRIKRLKARIARINICMARDSKKKAVISEYEIELKRREAELNYLELIPVKPVKVAM